ncbi:MAG: hypothetical protein WBA57_23690 [Elainellaceae cyanobacterium]
MKDIKKKIKIPIYFGELILILSEDLEKTAKDLGTSLGAPSNGFCWNGLDKGLTQYFIAIDKDATPSIIAHEASHCVNYIFKDRGIELDTHNDEPQCYLLSWIVDKCHEFLNKNK